MKNKTDLRIIKTRNGLYDALILLLKEKTFEEIKVSDICKKALINRSTFYAHFQDKYELFASLIDDLKQSLNYELKNINKDLTVKEYYIELIRVFLDHIEGKEEIYNSIIINNKNSIIMDMIYDTINEDISKKLDDLDIPTDIASSYYLGGVVNVGMYWLRNGKKYTKDEMLDFLNKLI